MSASGSVSTVSGDDNLVSSSEDSSSPHDSDLQLGLGLSLGGGGGNSWFKLQQQASFGAQYATIFTAKNFTCSSFGKPSHASATAKRSADSMTNAASQVVGWPPIGAYRMNSMTNQGKSVATEEYNSMIEKHNRKNGVVTVVEKTTNGSNKNKDTGKTKTSLFVKVNMDGIPIGRKVDLNTHRCYETLADTLEDMFHRPTTNVTGIRSSIQEHDSRVEATRSSKLLNGMSDFVLTYEDKEGDWMLVGDVPWGMFLDSVKRLRIMRTTEATGAAPRLHESSGRQTNKPV